LNTELSAIKGYASTVSTNKSLPQDKKLEFEKTIIQMLGTIQDKDMLSSLFDAKEIHNEVHIKKFLYKFWI